MQKELTTVVFLWCLHFKLINLHIICTVTSLKQLACPSHLLITYINMYTVKTKKIFIIQIVSKKRSIMERTLSVDIIKATELDMEVLLPITHLNTLKSVSP